MTNQVQYEQFSIQEALMKKEDWFSHIDYHLTYAMKKNPDPEKIASLFEGIRRENQRGRILYGIGTMIFIILWVLGKILAIDDYSNSIFMLGAGINAFGYIPASERFSNGKLRKPEVDSSRSDFPHHIPSCRRRRAACLESADADDNTSIEINIVKLGLGRKSRNPDAPMPESSEDLIFSSGSSMAPPGT
jgi:hypothetical protein